MITFSKKQGLLLLLLLTGCVPAILPTTHPTVSPTQFPIASPTVSPTVPSTISPTVFPTPFPTEAFRISLDAFKINDECPHICWLGINPGVTSAEDARALLQASDQIDHKNFYAAGMYIQTNWFFQKTTACLPKRPSALAKGW